MSYRKRHINPNTGEQQSGTVLEIVESSEPIARLKLEDGTLARVKVGVLEVMRMDVLGPDGKPTYDVNVSVSASFVAPEDQLDE